MPKKTPVSAAGREEERRSSKKRKIPSPIKPGQDYNRILRKQEISASPALKKHKDCGYQADDSEEEEEIVLLTEDNNESVMSGPESENGIPMDQGTTSGAGSQSRTKATFSLEDFTNYMDTNVTNQLLPLVQNLSLIHI